ncbi:mucin-6-like [Ornithodoros turicata]|uniref:mucin-6-like n=1 Tax=Ornithodoros turicata TaxID=34597 RepID=UPI00313A0C81
MRTPIGPVFLLLAAGLAAAAESSSATQPRREKDISTTRRTLQRAKFACLGKAEGYYADTTVDCEAFHYCKPDGTRYSFVCPPKSRFNQKLLICDYDLGALALCPESERYYQQNKTSEKDERKSTEAPVFVPQEEVSKPSTSVYLTKTSMKPTTSAPSKTSATRNRQPVSKRPYTTYTPRSPLTARTTQRTTMWTTKKPTTTTTASSEEDLDEYEDEYYDDEDTSEQPGTQNASLPALASKPEATTPKPQTVVSKPIQSPPLPSRSYFVQPTVPPTPQPRPNFPFLNHVPRPRPPHNERLPLRPFLQNPHVFLPSVHMPKERTRNRVPPVHLQNPALQAGQSFVEYMPLEEEHASYVSYAEDEHAPDVGQEGYRAQGAPMKLRDEYDPRLQFHNPTENQVPDSKYIAPPMWHEQNNEGSTPPKPIEPGIHSESGGSSVEYDNTYHDAPGPQHWGPKHAYPGFGEPSPVRATEREPLPSPWKQDQAQRVPWMSPASKEQLGVRYTAEPPSGRVPSSMSSYMHDIASMRKQHANVGPYVSQRKLNNNNFFSFATPRQYEGSSRAVHSMPELEATSDDPRSWRPLQAAEGDGIETNTTNIGGYYRTSSGMFEYRPARKTRSIHSRQKRQLLSRLFGRRPSFNGFSPGLMSGVARPFLFGGPPSNAPQLPNFQPPPAMPWAQNQFEPWSFSPQQDIEPTASWMRPTFQSAFKPQGPPSSFYGASMDGNVPDVMKESDALGVSATTESSADISNLHTTPFMSDATPSMKPPLDESFSQDNPDLSESMVRPDFASDNEKDSMSSDQYNEPSMDVTHNGGRPFSQGFEHGPKMNVPSSLHSMEDFKMNHEAYSAKVPDHASFSLNSQFMMNHEGHSQPDKNVPDHFRPSFNSPFMMNPFLNHKGDASHRQPPMQFHNEFQVQQPPNQRHTAGERDFHKHRQSIPFMMHNLNSQQALHNHQGSFPDRGASTPFHMVHQEAPEQPYNAHVASGHHQMHNHAEHHPWNMPDPPRTMAPPRMMPVRRPFPYQSPEGHKETGEDRNSFRLPNMPQAFPTFMTHYAPGGSEHLDHRHSSADNWNTAGKMPVLVPERPPEHYFSQQLPEEIIASSPNTTDAVPSTSKPASGGQRRRKPARRRRPKPTKVTQTFVEKTNNGDASETAPTTTTTTRPTPAGIVASSWTKPYGTRLHSAGTTPIPAAHPLTTRASFPSQTPDSTLLESKKPHSKTSDVLAETTPSLLGSWPNMPTRLDASVPLGLQKAFTFPVAIQASGRPSTYRPSSTSTTTTTTSSTTTTPAPRVLMLSSSPLELTADSHASNATSTVNRTTPMWHWTAAPAKSSTPKPTTLRANEMRIFSGKMGASVFSTASKTLSTRPPAIVIGEINDAEAENVIGNGRDKGFPFEFFTDVNRLTRTTSKPTSPYPVYRPPVTQVVTAISFSESSSVVTSPPPSAA